MLLYPPPVSLCILHCAYFRRLLSVQLWGGAAAARAGLPGQPHQLLLLHKATSTPPAILAFYIYPRYTKQQLSAAAFHARVNVRPCILLQRHARCALCSILPSAVTTDVSAGGAAAARAGPPGRPLQVPAVQGGASPACRVRQQARQARLQQGHPAAAGPGEHTGAAPAHSCPVCAYLSLVAVWCPGNNMHVCAHACCTVRCTKQ